jgi:hypothetical protein
VTARPNGEGNSLLSAGSTLGTGRDGWIPSLKYSIGLTDEIDLGFQYEVVEYGIWGKYALVRREEGWSVAALAGVGASFEGFYGYAGPIVSWKSGIFEPYFLTRFNYVRYPEQKMSVASVGELDVAPGTYRYLQYTVGFLIWPTDWFGTGLETSAFTPLRSPFILRDWSRLLFSWNMSFRF